VAKRGQVVRRLSGAAAARRASARSDALEACICAATRRLEGWWWSDRVIVPGTGKKSARRDGQTTDDSACVERNA
jgi:hypothetical protein